ncbi:MAG: hypothetical protein EOO56_07735 [Hymenobacter sp.]|nr:MAG: hypothetical protein EOO56_07735 [Hymenobacter sp.]
MTIERTADEVIIRLPATVDVEGLQQIIDYLSYREATKNSQATQAQVDELAREASQGWWANNRSRFLK